MSKEEGRRSPENAEFVKLCDKKNIPVLKGGQYVLGSNSEGGGYGT